MLMFKSKYDNWLLSFQITSSVVFLGDYHISVIYGEMIVLDGGQVLQVQPTGASSGGLIVVDRGWAQPFLDHFLSNI